MRVIESSSYVGCYYESLLWRERISILYFSMQLYLYNDTTFILYIWYLLGIKQQVLGQAAFSHICNFLCGPGDFLQAWGLDKSDKYSSINQHDVSPSF